MRESSGGHQLGRFQVSFSERRGFSVVVRVGSTRRALPPSHRGSATRAGRPAVLPQPCDRLQPGHLPASRVPGLEGPEGSCYPSKPGPGDLGTAHRLLPALQRCREPSCPPASCVCSGRFGVQGRGTSTEGPDTQRALPPTRSGLGQTGVRPRRTLWGPAVSAQRRCGTLRS